MEVKPGYKQTEVGLIPEDWEVGNLNGFWTVTDCKHVTAKFVHSGFPIVSIKEVQSRFVDLTNAKHTTQQFYNLLIEGGRKPRVGDLILSRNATVGEVAQVAEWHPLFAMGQDVCLLRKKSPEFSTDYLNAVFHSPIIANQLLGLMVGSTFKRVNVQQIKNFTVPFPPPSEQEAIAEALSDADALIESLEQLIAKKRQIKQGAMQELLTGMRRLPQFCGEWITKTLGNICKIEKGEQLNRDTLSPTDDYPVWNGGTEPSGFTSDWNTEADAVTVSEGGNSCGFVNFIHQRFWRGGHCYALKNIDNGVSQKYIYQYLKCREKDIMALRVGSGLPNIQRARLSGFEVLLPPFQEQTAIAAILSDMDAEIAALEAKLAKARRLKQGMMQEFLTGRIRLV